MINIFDRQGYLVIAIAANEVAAKIYPVLPKNDQHIAKHKSIRQRRQFEFGPPFKFDPQSGGFSNNGIFFDEDNTFQDFVIPNRPRSNQNNDFFGNPNFFGDGPTFNNDAPNNPTTQSPLGVTAVNIPGMGTTRSACEDRCLTTPQYNPVCGDNNVTYENIEKFKCAVRCGRNVQIAAYRACPRIMVK